MTEMEKIPYRKEADRLKAKLMEEHPDYNTGLEDVSSI